MPDMPTSFAPQTLSLTMNPNAAQYMKEKVDGRQMKALALKRITEIQRTKALGIAKPCSVLNFNPVPLTLEGGIAGKVPSNIDPVVPEGSRIEFEYKKRKYRASIVTFAEPVFYPWITDVHKGPTDEMADGVGVYDIRVCRQSEIAFNFWQDYNEGQFNSLRMGGVVAFEGDRYTLRAPKDPETPHLLNVPEFISLPDFSREYFCRPQLLTEVFAKCLDTQKLYYDLQMLTGSSYWNDPDQRKNITNIHLVWAQYGLEMGWREKPVDWQVSSEEPEGSCEGCGATRKRAAAYFCICGRPYDALKAYLDKELNIESVFMMKIKDEDWHLVEAEELRRRSRRERLGVLGKPIADVPVPSDAAAPAAKPKGKATPPAPAPDPEGEPNS